MIFGRSRCSIDVVAVAVAVAVVGVVIDSSSDEPRDRGRPVKANNTKDTSEAQRTRLILTKTTSRTTSPRPSRHQVFLLRLVGVQEQKSEAGKNRERVVDGWVCCVQGRAPDAEGCRYLKLLGIYK